MLVLTRKKLESIVVSGAGGEDLRIRIVVLDIAKGMVKLGIEAPPDVSVHRTEVWERIREAREVSKAS
jgi:carbon storage regulator